MLLKKSKWKILIRLLLQKQFDLGLHCLSRPFLQATTVVSKLTFTVNHWWERSCSVVECLTQDRGAEGSSVTALCLWARHINPSLVLVQPRKTCPYITERLLMGHKESNQTNCKPSRKHQLCSYFVTDIINTDIVFKHTIYQNMFRCIYFINRWILINWNWKFLTMNWLWNGVKIKWNILC